MSKPVKPTVQIAIMLFAMFSVSLVWVSQTLHHHPMGYFSSACVLIVLVVGPFNIAREWKRHRSMN